MKNDTTSARLVADVAAKIIDLAGDGTQLITVHKHYPTGWDAFSYGWIFGFGFCSGAGAVAAIGFAIDAVIGGAA